MRGIIAGVVGLGFALGAAGGAARAGAPEVWNFDLTTTGQNVFWTSPTAVDPGSPAYDYIYTVSLVEVNVRWGILNLGPLDVTDQVPPDSLMSMGTIDGPAPLVLFNDVIVYPEPPAAPGLAADLLTEINALGFGQMSATNVVLGNVQVDLGPPFGVQTVLITRVRLMGSIQIEPVEAACAGDLTGDGVVNASDLAVMLGGWGGAGPADLTLDGIVNASDLAILLGAWGNCP